MIPDPGYDDKEAGGEVVGHHVEAHLAGQHQLETCVESWNYWQQHSVERKNWSL